MLNYNNTILKVKILQNEHISRSTKVLKFYRQFNFKAGQVIGLTTNLKIPFRIYSIASAENSDTIEILFKIYPLGELTPILSKLNKGDEIFITLPFGKFLTPDTTSYLIATGTGLASYLSMLRSGNINEIILVHGSRDQSDFYYSDYLYDLLQSNYIRCYSGSDIQGFFTGRVTLYLESLNNLDTKYKYYLCGRAEMVVDTRELIIGKGIPFQNILSEIYF
jgi:ferredoxin/flavodoxin---NADP+ reductase